LPTPRRPDRGPGQSRERQATGRLGSERPGGGPIRHRQAFVVRANRRLAEDEADAPAQAGSARTAVPATTSRRFGPDGPGRRRSTDPDHGRGAAFIEGAQIVAEASLDRATRPALEPLDEPADGPDPVLERKPRMPFAPLAGRRWAHVAGLDPERANPAGISVQPARRQERMQEPEAE